MAWKLSGNKLPVWNSWQKNAWMLRTIVLSIPKLQPIDDGVIECFETMRAFNRGTITLDELRARLAKLGPPPKGSLLSNALHEPLEFHGWTVAATLVDWRGKAWWLAFVTKRTKSCSEGDKRWLYRVLDVIGCDPENDRVSMSTLEDLVAESVSFIYAWPNTFERTEVQLNKAGDMRIVPHGTRPTDGFERIPDDESKT